MYNMSYYTHLKMFAVSYVVLKHSSYSDVFYLQVDNLWIFLACSFKPVDQQGTHCRVKVFTKKDSRSQLTHLEDIQVYIENHPDYDVENCPDYD